MEGAEAFCYNIQIKFSQLWQNSHFLEELTVSISPIHFAVWNESFKLGVTNLVL